jgi:hypothetical protein
MERIHSPLESDKYEVVHYVAVKPRKRDFLRVLFGAYVPQVKREARITTAGMNKVVKETFTAEAMREQFFDESPLLAMFKEAGAGDEATVPIRKNDPA